MNNNKWAALCKSSIGLSPEDERREQIKEELSSALARCRSQFEAIQILFSNDLKLEAAFLLSPFLSNTGNLLLELNKVSTASDLEGVSDALDKLDGPAREGFDSLFELIDKAKGQSPEAMEPLVHHLVTKARMGQLLNRLEKIFGDRRRQDLKTALDAHRRRRKTVLASIALVLGLIVYGVYGFYSNKTLTELSDIRVADLTALKTALEAYKAENGSYPTTGGRFSCAIMETPDWIPGLAPRYMPELPRDPGKSNRCYQQYIYISNGRDYKLLVNHPEDLELVRQENPDLIDPRREDSAYGFWSDGFAYN